jgi:TolB protein
VSISEPKRTIAPYRSVMEQERPTPPRSRRRLQVAVAITLLAAVAVLAAVQVSGLARILDGGSSEPNAPPRIAVVGADGALATVDDHGGSVVSHPVNGVTFQFPAWSPDGSRVAAIGNATGSGGVYVFQARGTGGADPAAPTEPTVIYRSPDKQPFYLYWSPDSRQVTFLTTEPVGLALRVAPADASSPGAILRQGAPLYWDWVDPTRALVNIAAGGPDAFLGEVGLDGAAGQPAATAGVFRSPAMTRDGSRRAYVVNADQGAETIVIESRQGGDRHEIPVPGLPAIAFAPGGTSLAFIAPSATGSQPAALPIGPLRIVDVGSGSVRTILDGLIVAFFWSPDGKTIATLRIPAPADAASTAGLVPPSLGAASGYLVRLAFIDVATGDVRSTREVQVTELFGLQVLPFFDQYALSHRLWSPDSRSLLLPLVGDDGTDGLVVLPADGSDSRIVAKGEMGFWSP